MPHFFVAPEQISNDRLSISGEDAHHIARSLRMAAGDSITVSDGVGKEYDCILESFEGDALVTARIVREMPLEGEPPFFLTVFQGLPKGDKLDLIIQKAVECGAGRIVPFESTNCTARIKEEAEDRKGVRRSKIAAEAAKQCGRGRIPAVERTVSFADALTKAREAELILFCYEREKETTLRSCLDAWRDQREQPVAKTPEIAVFIGSEGGFTPEEAEKARAGGCYIVSLGNRILRTETVAPFLLGALSYEFG